MQNDWVNTPENELENSETSQIKWKSKEMILKEYYEDFLSSKINSWDKSKDIEFYNRIIKDKDWYISKKTTWDEQKGYSFLLDLRNHILYNHPDFWAVNIVDLEKITDKKLILRDILSYWINVETLRKSSIDLIKKEYIDIENGWELSWDNLDFIVKEIEKLNQDELFEITKNSLNRLNFLKKIFWKNYNKKIKTKENEKIENAFDNLLSKINFQTLDENKKNAIINLLADRKRIFSLWSEDDVFEFLELFDSNQKLELLKVFSPVISLGKLCKNNNDKLSYWFLDKEKIIELLKNSVKNWNYKQIFGSNINQQLEDIFKIIKDRNKEDIFDIINLDDIFVDINDIINLDDIWDEFKSLVWQSLFTKAIASKITQEYNQSVDESIKDFKHINFKIDVEGSVLSDFKKQVEISINEKSEKIKWLKKFNAWSCIKLTKKDENKETIDLIKIDELNQWVEWVPSSQWINYTSLINNEKWFISYSELYNHFLKIDNAVILSEEESKQDLDIAQINNLNEWQINDLDNLNLFLDDIDENWKLFNLNKLKKVVFYTWEPNKDNDDYWVFTVELSQNGNNLIVKDSWWIIQPCMWLNEWSFSNFYWAFKDSLGRRCWDFQDINWLITSLQNKKTTNDKIHEKYDWLVFKDWQIVDEKNNEKDYTYFIWEDWKNTVKIDKIDWDKIDISFWDLKNKKAKDWEKLDKDSKDGFEFQIWFKKTVSLQEFYWLINKYWCTPYEYHQNQENDSNKIDLVNKNSNLFKNYMSKPSLFQLIKWWKKFIDTIKSKLEYWRDVNSLRFAASLWKMIPFLPADWTYTLNNQVQSAEIDLTAKLKDEIKKMPSEKRYKYVRKIILDRDSEYYEINAALLATLEKTWTLYPTDLSDLEWKYVWYNAYCKWWFDHAYFNEIKTRFDWKAGDGSWNRVFSELALVEEWAFKYWKEKNWWLLPAEFFKKIRWAAQSWVDEEVKDAETKTATSLDVQERVWYGIKQIKDNLYPNALGSIKPIFDKASSNPIVVNKVPFLLMACGATKNMDKSLLDKFNKIYTAGYPVPMLLFAFNPDSWVNYTELLYRVMIRFAYAKSKQKWDELYKLLTISNWTEIKWLDDLKIDSSVISSAKSKIGTVNHEKHIDNLWEFWDKNGQWMIDKMHMTADPQVMLEKEKVKDFDEYHKQIMWWFDYYSYNKDQIWEHVCNYWHSNFLLMDTFKVLDKLTAPDRKPEMSMIEWKSLKHFKLSLSKAIKTWIKDLDLEWQNYKRYAHLEWQAKIDAINADKFKIFQMYNKWFITYLTQKLPNADKMLNGWPLKKDLEDAGIVLPYKLWSNWEIINLTDKEIDKLEKENFEKIIMWWWKTSKVVTDYTRDRYGSILRNAA